MASNSECSPTAPQRIDPMRRPEALFFDLDGVLADVSRSYRRAIVETARSLGVAVSSEQIVAAKAAGSANNDWVLTQALLAANGVSASLAEVTDRFERIYQGTAASPGLWRDEPLIVDQATVARFANAARLGIVTGRPQRDAMRFLEHNAIAQYFEAVVCMEDAPPKPDPAPVNLLIAQMGTADAWLVGDTPDDMRAACAANVLPFGVVAPGDPSERIAQALVESGAVRVLKRLDELVQLLAGG